MLFYILLILTLNANLSITFSTIFPEDNLQHLLTSRDVYICLLRERSGLVMEYTIVLVDAVEELLLDADICSVTLHISVDFVGMLRSRTARASFTNRLRQFLWNTLRTRHILLK